jgi:uncharacterized protein YoxC
MPQSKLFITSLALLAGVILILFIVILCRVISMLSKVDNMLQEAQNTIESVQSFVAKPMKVVLQLAEQFSNIMGFFAQEAVKIKRISHEKTR